MQNHPSIQAAKGLTLLETLIAVTLLAIILSAIIPLLRISGTEELRRGIQRDPVDLAIVADTLAANPESFQIDMTTLKYPDQHHDYRVPEEVMASSDHIPSSVTLTTIHTFTNDAGRFALVSIQGQGLTQYRLLRTGDSDDDNLLPVPSREEDSP